MQEKSVAHTFSKIKQEENAVLEAGIIQGALKLRLTIPQSSEVTSVYIGQIRNMEEHEKLQENFETVSDVMKWISDSSNLKLDLVNMSVIILAKVGVKNAIEIGKIKLNKEENEKSELKDLDELENLIDSEQTYSNTTKLLFFQKKQTTIV